MSVSQKATLLLSAVLLILSLAAILYFVCLSVASFVTTRFAYAWSASFLLSSAALGGWMLFYAGLLRIGGGLMYLRRNVVLFWILIITVLASATVRFSGSSSILRDSRRSRESDWISRRRAGISQRDLADARQLRRPTGNPSKNRRLLPVLNLPFLLITRTKSGFYENWARICKGPESWGRFRFFLAHLASERKYSFSSAN